MGSEGRRATDWEATDLSSEARPDTKLHPNLGPILSHVCASASISIFAVFFKLYSNSVPFLNQRRTDTISRGPPLWERNRAGARSYCKPRRPWPGHPRGSHAGPAGRAPPGALPGLRHKPQRNQGAQGPHWPYLGAAQSSCSLPRHTRSGETREEFSIQAV